jgi:large subunit ribosomal protein L24
MRKTSKQPRKQRKMQIKLSAHRRRREMSAHLSQELRKKYARRSFPVVKGDRVKIIRGQHRGKSGKVTMIDRKAYFIGVEKISVKKPDGKEVPVLIRPSNVIITEIHLADIKRKNALERLVGVGKAGAGATATATTASRAAAEPAKT